MKQLSEFYYFQNVVCHFSAFTITGDVNDFVQNETFFMVLFN